MNNVANSAYWVILICLLILCAGCGEIRHYKALEPTVTNDWKVHKDKYQREDINVARYSTTRLSIEVRMSPLLDDQKAVGPILPVIPNPFDNIDPTKNLVTLIISVTPPLAEADTEINEVRFVADGKYTTPKTAENFKSKERSVHRLLFDFGVSHPQEVDLILPSFGTDSPPPPLKYKLFEETKYRIVPPRGLFQ